MYVGHPQRIDLKIKEGWGELIKEKTRWIWDIFECKTLLKGNL